MMSLPTKAILAVVEEDHTVKLPADMPVGAKVAIFLMPTEEMQAAEQTREARFAAALALINEAAKKPQKEVSKEEVHALVDEARRARRT